MVGFNNCTPSFVANDFSGVSTFSSITTEVGGIPVNDGENPGGEGEDGGENESDPPVSQPPISEGPPVQVDPVPEQQGVVYAPQFLKPAAAGEIVGLIFQNNKTSVLPARYVTFGHPFVKGKLPANAKLRATIGGNTYQVQMDVKTKHSDGTVKMAVLTVLQPSLPANSQAKVMLSTGGQSSGEVNLNDLSDYSMKVALQIQGRSSFNVDVGDALKAALQNGSASYWLKGPYASQARVQVLVAGSMRLVFDVTKYADGSFSTDAQFNNDIAMTADGGKLTYDAQVTHKGSVQNFSLVHPQYMQWHRVYYTNGKPGVNIQHDPANLIQSGAVLPYNIGVGVVKSVLDGYAAKMSSGDWTAPFAKNSVTQYMPGTGGRPDIGTTTEYNASWIATQSEIARDIALYQADTAAAVPWHFFDVKNNVFLNTDHYPNLWTDGRGGNGTAGDRNSGGLTQQVEGTPLGWTPDTAHQPDLSYIPYIATGGRYYLDQVTAQASAGIMGYWPSQWTRLKGGINTNLVEGNQIRGAAWSLRHLAQVANFGVDGSVEKAYYEKALKENLNHIISQMPSWQSKQGEVYGYIACGTYGTNKTGYGPATPPWQQDYMISALAIAAFGGTSEARTILQWMSNFRVGMFMNESKGFNPRNGVSYLVGTSNSDGTQVYTTWSALQAGTESIGQDNGSGWSKSGGNYGQLGAASLSLLYYTLGDQRAKVAYEWLMSVKPPYVPMPDEPMREPNTVMMAPR